MLASDASEDASGVTHAFLDSVTVARHGLDPECHRIRHDGSENALVKAAASAGLLHLLLGCPEIPRTVSSPQCGKFSEPHLWLSHQWQVRVFSVSQRAFVLFSVWRVLVKLWSAVDYLSGNFALVSCTDFRCVPSELTRRFITCFCHLLCLKICS